jgi:capsular exopolysaccharide synthesis family protein
MGALPPAPVRRPAVAEPQVEAWHSAFHESVAAARTMLLHVARAESMQVVMVTSAVAGEGKTSLSSQLAASLARAGHKTLLVDGDLRKPDLHQVFGLSVVPGLSEWLRGANGASDTIQRTSVANLWLLPAGDCDGHTLQVLAQDRLKGVFDEMKEMFEFIIVDSSPVLPVADAVQIGRHVDAALFSILRNVSRLPRVYAASQRLTQLRVQVLGAVVLNAQADVDNYGFHKVAAQAKCSE